MDYKQLHLTEYKKLFFEYKNEYELREKNYLISVGKNPMHYQVNPDQNPEYFRNEEEFKAKMIGLNAPLLKMSKFKIGDSINVKYSGQELAVKISHIQVSGCGSGELLYFF